jgi:MoaA/NifB/PqqE/SkfB family radical SAM enzyme
MKWFPEDIEVFLDVSTYCNAGCPQCHRTSEDGLGKIDWLPLIQWDLKTFQKAFPLEELQNVKKFDFCGTWGDPVMCKELDKMFEYIIQNSNARVTMNTNGSIRSEEWWWNLGVMCAERLQVTFDIDGPTQEMHARYRRFTDLQKVLDNMQSLSNTHAYVSSQTIVFKHNQDYKTEIEDLVREYGSRSHTFAMSDRFDGNNTVDGKRWFTNEDGEKEYLEKPDKISGGFIAGAAPNQDTLSDQIVCRWSAPRNEIVINPDGQVMPCCYHANAHMRGLQIKDAQKELHRHEIYADGYNKDLKAHNVFHTPLSDILKSKWYTETLPNSIRSEKPVQQCARQCSTRLKKDHQLRIINEL